MSSVRDVLMVLVSKMQQPSLPELMDFATSVSFFHGEYRKLTTKRYAGLYQYLTHLIRDNKILQLKATSGYQRRYCIYPEDRRFDRFVEPIPKIIPHSNPVKLQIFSKEITVSEKNGDLQSMILDTGQELQILRFESRIFIILDHVLLGVASRSQFGWNVRMPWRITGIGTELGMVFKKLRSLDVEVDVLGVKGKRTICGG